MFFLRVASEFGLVNENKIVVDVFLHVGRKFVKVVFMAREKDKTTIDVGEAVGVVAAQSIGEPGTQMSLAYDEKVIVREGSEVRIEKIGEFIDSAFERFGFVNEGGHEICDLPIEIYAPSLTEHEKIEWRKITALSRHKSPEKMLFIKTRSGRTITATPFHSFVVRKDNQITPIAGSALKKGDRLPALRNLALPEDSTAIERVDAKPVLETRLKYLACNNGTLRAYPRESSKPLPQCLELDGEFGWLFGIYLAEGNSTRNYFSISATEQPIIEKLHCFTSAYNLTSNEYDNTRGFSLGHDVHINSTLFSQFFKATCGTGSREKHVPQFAFSASEEFIGALLKGYFDGDGNVTVERKAIRAFSNSKALIDGVTLLLARLGIFASKKREKQGYTLSISHRHAELFLEKIGSDIEEKRTALELLASAKSKSDYNLVDVIPGVGKTLKTISSALGIPSRAVNSSVKRDKAGRSTLKKYIALFETLAESKKASVPELAVLKQAVESDAVWDEITAIEYIEPATRHVYDFTVPGTETFTTFDGIVTHNTMRTFHYAGVAEQVPTGLPRLIEIVDARRAPKKPLMDIHLEKGIAKNEEKAMRIAEGIEGISLGKVADIEENFVKKLIIVTIDEKILREEAVSLSDVKKLIKDLAGEDVEDGETRSQLKIKVKGGKLRAIRKLSNKLAQLHLKGIKNISRSMVIRGLDEYVIRTGGSNIAEVIKWPGVDSTRIYTNDIKEVERSLGIEAARNAIIQEIKMVLDTQGLDVDLRHIMLLADAMTMDGSVKSVGRHGLSGEKAGILARAAFEETIKHLVAAAIKSDEDTLVGVTENIIIGQSIPVGTGIVKLEMKRKEKK
ncbi:DNA-directed RNA polymerase subunit A'' [Candidatus Micrarchaeota archaeon]|nr:DNA-directed RNA polymerase subunit A'' [Candidatus Micrarchaeota archaeon]